MFPRPVFSLFHQPFAHAMRSVRVIHHEPADLAASLRFHRAHHEDVKVIQEPPIGRLRDKQRVVKGRIDSAKSFPNVFLA